MQDTARSALRSIPQPSNPLLALLFVVDSITVVVVGEVVPSPTPGEELLVSAARLESLADALPAGAAVAVADVLLASVLLNTPASTNFVHAPTTFDL